MWPVRDTIAPCDKLHSPAPTNEGRQRTENGTWRSDSTAADRREQIGSTNPRSAQVCDVTRNMTPRPRWRAPRTQMERHVIHGVASLRRTEETTQSVARRQGMAQSRSEAKQPDKSESAPATTLFKTGSCHRWGTHAQNTALKLTRNGINLEIQALITSEQRVGAHSSLWNIKSHMRWTWENKIKQRTLPPLGEGVMLR